MRKLLRCIVAVLAIISSTASAQLVDVINEVVASSPAGAFYPPSGYTTYRIYARLQDPNDRMNAVFGSTSPSPIHHLKIGSSNNGDVIWNTSFGGFIMDQLNAALFGVFPEVQWDSAVSIGKVSSASPGGQIFTISNPANMIQGSFSTTLSSGFNPDLTIVDGAWFILNDGTPNGFPVGADNRILIGQVTVPTGTLTYQLNISIFNAAVGDDQLVYVHTLQDPPGFVGDYPEQDATCQGLVFPEAPQCDAVPGCTDVTACNFDPNATEDDGSCTYPGCTDPSANNYDPTAGCDDGSCTFDIPGCTDATACNFNPNATVNDGSCTYPGCTDPTACNFNPNAGCPDSSCTYPGCTNNLACNYNPTAGCDNGSCVFPGCTDQDACNYNPTAGCDNGSCTYPGCTNGFACNYNPAAGCDDGSCTFPGCTDPDANNYDPEAGCDDGSCTYDVPGCTDDSACNYNPDANVEDGSCTYPGCTDDTACNYDATAGCSDDSCTYPGCTDAAACNYDSTAGCEDGSCTYPGCTDNDACNYDATAGCDDGSCTYPGCTDDAACNYDGTAGCDDGSCTYPGCTSADACNYNASAGCDDGSCTYPGCIDEEACNYNADAGCGDDSCTYPGCTDPNANNYDPTAGCDDGSCVFDEFGCTDETACNYDPNATVEDGSCTYPGCTSPGACNYNIEAGCDDGSCYYPTVCGDPAACNYDPSTIDGCSYGLCTYPGCTDPSACNFDADAACEDGSCEYTSCAGCTDAEACNYNAGATIDDGSCTYPGCTDEEACNYNADAGCSDDSCTYPGCTDSDATNYDPTAGCDDGSCVYDEFGCTDATACNYDDNATIDDGSCTYPGCTDDSACNYNGDAGCDDGSCTYPGCLNPGACNYDPTAGCDLGSCTFPGCTDATACNYDATAGCDNGTCTYPGCTDSDANNYDPNAGCDDGSCTYDYPGCTDETACNYDALANVDDGSCTYPGCTDPDANNYDPTAGCDDGSCSYDVPGCTVPSACNYNPDATINDGSCVYPGCTNPLACNYSPNAGCDNGSCTFPGCTDVEACNYNEDAGCNDGSCTYPGCTDPQALNYDPDAGCGNPQIYCEYDPNQCLFICPGDATVECGDDTSPENTGSAYYTGGCGYTYVWFEDGEISGDECHSWFVRTWYGVEYQISSQGDTNGNYDDICTQTIHIVDTTGPVFDSTPSDLTVQCIDEVPAPEDLTATDDCSDDVTVEVFASNSLVVRTCNLTTANGPGPDWAVWLPGLPGAASDYWVFVGNGTFNIFADGTAHVFGTLQNVSNNTQQFQMNLWLENQANWDDWSALGRSYKDDLNLATPGQLYEAWDYFEIVGGFSTFTGIGAWAGSALYVYHYPTDYYFGFQSGWAANNKNANYGSSAWFTYWGFVNGVYAQGHGDINVDQSCTDLQNDCTDSDNEYTYIWRAEDGCGNVTFTSQTITVLDTTDPWFVNCPEDVHVECYADVAGIYVPTVDDLIVEDNCDLGGNVVTAVPGTPIWLGDECTGSLTYRWSIEDCLGNESICEYVISWDDSTAPWIEGTPQIELECGEAIPYLEPAAGDNCDANVTITYVDIYDNEIECPLVTHIVRIFTATDDCGNYSTFTQNILVYDTQAPVFETNNSQLWVECSDLASVAAIPVWDACSEVEVWYTDVCMSGGCLGVIQRTYHAQDACYNTSTAVQYIHVVDTTAPIIVCPSNLTVECDDVPSIDELGVYAYDECEFLCLPEYDLGLTAISTIIPGDCENSYDIVITWSATDYCENVGSCTTVIHVQDTTNPWFTWVPEDQTVECSDELPAIATAYAADNCDQEPEIIVTEETTPGDCPQEYILHRIYRAYDNCGNYTMYVQNIYVVDTTAPWIEGQSQVVIECGEDVPYIEPFAGDNCSEVVGITYTDYTSYISPWWFYSTAGGNGAVDFSGLPTQIILEGSNNSGAFTEEIGGVSGVFTAAVATAKAVQISFDWDYNTNDVDGPAFDPFGYYVNGVFTQLTDDGGADSQSGSATILVPAYSDFALSIWAEDDIFGNAAVNITNITITEIPSDEECPYISSILRQFVATDECGNSSVFNQIILIQDTTGPIIVGDYEIERPCDDYAGVYVTAYDECTEVYGLTYEDEFVSGTCQGHILRTYTAWDECYNYSYFVQIITLVDYVAPYVEEPQDFTVECSYYYEVYPPYAWDNCDYELDLVPSSSSTTDGCTTWWTYTWTYTDNCGNSTTVDQVVTIVDTTAPFWEYVPYGGEYSCDETIDYGWPYAWDWCDEVVDISYTDEIIPGECPQSYTIARTWYAWDDCLNYTYGYSYYYVYDNEAPEWTYVPSDITIECDEVVPFEWATAVDNCGNTTVTYFDEYFGQGTCYAYIWRTFVAVDECYNYNYAYQTITIVDTTAPVITGAYEIELPCDDYEGYYITATDNCQEILYYYYDDEYVSGTCQGHILRTYTVYDYCYNYSTFEQIITLVDYVPPVVEEPTDFTIECGISYLLIPPYAYDNCDDELEMTAISSTATDGCTVWETYVWTYTDNCGNSTSVDLVVTIVDTTAPYFEYVPYGGDYGCDEEIPYYAATAYDWCDEEVDVTYYDNTYPGICPQSYTIERVWVATDDCDNVAYAYTYYYIYDYYAPVFTFVPESLTVECDDEIPFVWATATDNCGNVTVSYSDETYGDGCYSWIYRTFTAVDECYNYSYAYQIITIVDTTPPVISGDYEIDLPCDNYEGIYISATDNCQDLLFYYYYDQAVSGTCQGHILRTYYVYDYCDNLSTFDQIITLVDYTAPYVDEPTDFTVECTQEYGVYPPYAWDNCDYELTLTTGSSSDSDGCTTWVTYTWTYTDNCGNSTTVDQVVTIVDTYAPIWEYVPYGGEYSCDEDIPYEAAIAFDYCDPSVTVVYYDYFYAGDCPNSYTIQREWVAYDNCNNYSYAYTYYYVYDWTAPTFDSSVSDVYVQCYDDIPAILDITATDNCGTATVTYSTEVITADECGNTIIYVLYTAVDECWNYNYQWYYITVYDDQAPVLIGCPDDLVLECTESVPDAADVTAVDNCDDDVTVYYNEYIYGDVPEEGSEGDCDLITPPISTAGNCQAAYNYTSWAMVLFGQPIAYKYYQVVGDDASFTQFDDGTAHLQVTLANANNANGGFIADVWFYNGMDWTGWDNLPYPTGFKADCAGLDAEHVNWTYYLMNNSAATLTGWGDYAGSFITLTHAPANNYFGYQVGLGANNLTPGYGSGGWFEYVGTIIDASTGNTIVVQDLPGVNNAGDFAFEHDCCPDYYVVREWCAVDCSGNWSCCTQSISFEGNPIVQEPTSPETEKDPSAIKDDFDFVAISPNPATDYSRIDFTTKVNDKITMEAYDMAGRRVEVLFQGTVLAGQTYRVDVNTSRYENGIYQIRLYSLTDSRTKKLIIER